MVCVKYIGKNSKLLVCGESYVLSKATQYYVELYDFGSRTFGAYNFRTLDGKRIDDGLNLKKSEDVYENMDLIKAGRGYLVNFKYLWSDKEANINVNDAIICRKYHTRYKFSINKIYNITKIDTFHQSFIFNIYAIDDSGKESKVPCKCFKYMPKQLIRNENLSLILGESTGEKFIKNSYLKKDTYTYTLRVLSNIIGKDIDIKTEFRKKASSEGVAIENIDLDIIDKFIDKITQDLKNNK